MFNIHEWVRPEKKRWRLLRERRDYETVRQGYNELKWTASDEAAPHYTAVARQLLDWNIPRGARILDAGCGTGLLCRELRAAGFTNLTAFDISDENVEQARKHANRVFRSSCESIAEPDSTYDLILHLTVIEHVIDVEADLRELHRLLKPGGLLYVTTDNAWWQTLLAIKEALWKPRVRYERLMQPLDGDFTVGEMRGLLRNAGFHEKRFVSQGGIPIGDSVLRKVFRISTTENRLFRHFTTRMGFLAQKAGI